MPANNHEGSVLFGRVTKVEKIGSLTYEVSLTQAIDTGRFQEGMVSGSITHFVHFKPWQSMPKVGDVIGASTKDHYSSLKQRLLSWVCCWWCHDGDLPYGARLEPAE